MTTVKLKGVLCNFWKQYEHDMNIYELYMYNVYKIHQMKYLNKVFKAMKVHMKSQARIRLPCKIFPCTRVMDFW